jgi:hypothetical protein
LMGWIQGPVWALGGVETRCPTWHLTIRFHGISVDEPSANGYSVRILGKYLVIIANPVQHPMPAKAIASRPFRWLRSQTTPTQMSGFTALTGGHFSA